MAYLAIYRKYRPVSFDKVVGQDHIVKTLVNQIENQRLGHAYLFTGSRGTGKTSTAKIFAKAINCEHPVNGSPCGKCSACLALNDPSNLDIMEIDAASNNGVNEIRDLRDKVQFPPVSCRYKVYIIDEVHMLTGPAFNALLKTLEEPPKHAVFILATTEVHKIPATILSRCMRFDFRLVSIEQIAELITKIFDEQDKLYDKEAIFALAKAGEGSIRDALSVADTAFSYSEGKLTYKDVLEILGSTGLDLLNDFANALISSSPAKTLSIIEKLSSLGKSIGVLIKDVQAYFRDLMVIKTCDNASQILSLPSESFNQLKEIAEQISEKRILYILQSFAEIESAVKYSNNPRILFETVALKTCQPETDYTIDALMVRVKELEDKISSLLSGQIALKRADEPIETKEKQKSASQETITTQQKPEKIIISTASITDIKGKLLSGLRELGSEMLWNIVQTVNVAVKDGSVCLIPKDENDKAVLVIEDNLEKLKLALNDYEFSSLVIENPLGKVRMDKIDEASERLKKMFGDDIVIIK